jgi:two-component system, OmpR family, response regulator
MSNKVLIVDDEIDICLLLKSLLNTQAINSVYVQTLTDAAEKIKAQPKILFLDMNLPDGNGIQRLEEFKKESPSTNIIMMSAYDTAEDRSMALNKGADVFLSKPFTRKQILDIVHQFSA